MVSGVDRIEQQEKADLLFEVWYCRPGNPPGWTTPNLYAADPTIEENEPNVVVAEVSNDGPGAASNFLVKLGLLEQSGATRVQIGQITISLAFPTELVNPTIWQQQIRLDVAASCCVGPDTPGTDCACSGWEFRSSLQQIDMAPDDCSVPVMLELEAVDPDALREARFDVTFVGTDPGGVETMLNGVTVGARLDCAPGPLQWVSKTRLGWSGSGFRTCGDVYDLARGPVPILGGDLSTADCLA